MSARLYTSPFRFRETILRSASVLVFCFGILAAPAALPADTREETAPPSVSFAPSADTSEETAPPSASSGASVAAAQNDESGDRLPPSSLRRPESQLLYYYLLLSHGLYDNDREIVSAALRGLLALDPSLPVFQDAVTILLSRGEYAEGEETVAEGLKRFPDDDLLTRLSAGLYSESGRAGDAQALLETFLAQHPEARAVREELVRLYIRDGRHDKITALLPDLSGADASPEADMFRAGVLSTVGRAAEARALLRELLTKKPALVEAWLELAYLSERDKDGAEAELAYRKALELVPDSREVLLRLVSVLLQAKKPDAALDALANADPDARLFLQAAARFAEAGGYREAENLVTRAESKGGSPDEAALVLSMIRRESAKNPKAGLEPLARIRRDSPLYPMALEQKASIYLMAGEPEPARSVAHEGRKLFPERKELWGLEAFAFARQKKTTGAEAVLKEALKQHPDDEDLLFSLGNIQDEAGKTDAALGTMEKILTVNPVNYHALNYVGYTLADRNTELDRALALITRALAQNPEADYIMDSLAWVQHRLGRNEDAWASIKRCIGLGGDDAVIWEHYGDIALAVGKKNEAAHGYRQALQRDAADKKALRRKLNALRK
jgi:tetratricopeptide (TPR) repeat protein